LEDVVRLVSPLDYFKLPQFLRICDVAVDPKGVDTRQASGKMLNYMAAGLPIVCFNKTNNRKYLNEGGYFCRCESAQSLAEGFLFFLENPEEAKVKGEINQKNSINFSWIVSAKKIEVIYNKIK